LAIIDVVKFDGLRNRSWLVYKHPSDNLVMGTQLIVGEGQVAVFMKSGQICDVFTAGTYTLSTQNLPLLQGIVNLPFGKRTPFTAEIFYLNIVTKLDIHWGTSDPISIVDPKYSVRLRIRAFGQMGFKLKDYSVFLRELVGVMEQKEMVQFEKLQEFFRGVIVQRIKVLISDIIINKKISALEITPRLDEISEATRERIQDTFETYGLGIANFFIKSINFPDEDFDKINEILAKRAEFDLIGDARYATARTFDVYEGAAKNEGGIAGAMVAGGVGLGAGVAIGGQMPNVMANTAPSGVFCSSCNTNNTAGTKFCAQCGNNLQAPPPVQEAPAVKCSRCGADCPNTLKFCGECGNSLALPKCTNCSAELAAGLKFCGECGTEVAQ